MSLGANYNICNLDGCKERMVGNGGEGNRGLASGWLARRFLMEVWTLLCPLDLFGTHSDATRRGQRGYFAHRPIFYE